MEYRDKIEVDSLILGKNEMEVHRVLTSEF